MAKNRKEYEMAIKIAGEIENSFYSSTKMTKKELREIAKQATYVAEEATSSSDKIYKSLKKGLSDAEPTFSGLEKAAKTSFKAVAAAAAVAGTAIVAGLGASISKGSEFESAFAGVKKTVNATGAELTQMRDDIRQMAKEMPTSAAGLSEIAESAGQLGIETQNIIGFTKTMADLEVATNLTREEGASDFARFANITKMQQDNFDELGSSVVALGNNMATTEVDIVSMGMRIAAAGTQVKLSQADIMGYAASLSSVGIEAEAGGSAFSKLLVNMQLAAETGAGLKKYARVAGMTGVEFKKAFQEDATTAINAFLSGLNNAEQNGKSAIAVLDEMGIKEVRLRDTLLRAANASGLFDNALQISNTAWKENTALANEAEQRYITFESQMDMLGNKISDVGISVYDDLKPGLTEAIKLANEFVDSMAGKEDAVGDVITSVTKKMPTMVRQVREAGEAVGDFAEPFLAVGGWLVENPGLIVGTVAGIGTALTTYKVASRVMSLVGALGSLGPVGATILGIGGVAAVITGIGTAVRKSAAEAKRANLDAHFGNIALSIQELEDVASYIVKSKDLEKITESVSAMKGLDSISDDIKGASEELNRMNWKVSVGMELTDVEQEDYRLQVQSYISSTQRYLEQKQYAVNLAVGVLTDDDLEGSNIISQINSFYADKQDQLASLGKQLNETITDAFQDGLLDIDEVKEITELQRKMAKIQETMAGAEFSAEMELLNTKYSAGELDAESFRNLQAELQEKVETATADYEESFKMSVANAEVMRKEGDINQYQYDNMVSEFQENYLEKIGGLQAQAAEFQTRTIAEQYADEIGGLVPEMREKLDSILGDSLNNIASTGVEAWGWDPELIYESLYVEIGKDTKAALEELWEDLSPQLDKMQKTAEKYIEAGQEVPESIAEGIQDTAMIGAMVGDANALYTIMGESAQDSEEYRQLLGKLQEQGIMIPEQIAQAIRENKKPVVDAVNDMYRYAAWEAAVNLPEMNLSGKALYSQKYLGNSIKAGHADGGIFDKPHIAWFAEKGPEAAIPIDHSANAISLWMKTGDLLGMDGLTSGNEPLVSGIESASYMGVPEVKISYSPQLYFSGSSETREEIEGVMESEQDRFNRQMNQWAKENLRFNFAR